MILTRFTDLGARIEDEAAILARRNKVKDKITPMYIVYANYHERRRSWCNMRADHGATCVLTIRLFVCVGDINVNIEWDAWNLMEVAI